MKVFQNSRSIDNLLRLVKATNDDNALILAI